MNHRPGPDKRKWRIVVRAAICKHCGCHPIAARTGQNGVGWRLECPTDYKHGHNFEQWLSKCIRRWDYFHQPTIQP